MCVVAALALGVGGVVLASPALASCNQECKEQKHALHEAKKLNKNAKSQPGPSEYADFKECPWDNPEVESCFYGKSEKGSYFKAGNVTVHLEKPIVIQGGLLENPETGVHYVRGARHGHTLEVAKQPAPSLEEVVEPNDLSESERARYEKFVAAGKTKGTAAVELAGPADELQLHEGHLLEEEGVALALPTQVRLENSFLGKTCYVGSDQNPIYVELTTGPSGSLHGSAGQTSFVEEGAILHIRNNRLVNGTFASPGATGCGINGGADAALDAKMGLPSAEGNEIVIAGQLAESLASRTKEELEP